MRLAKYRWFRRLQCLLGYKHILKLAPVPKSLQNVMSRPVISNTIPNDISVLEKILLGE
jgi:hypothetical protein